MSTRCPRPRYTNRPTSWDTMPATIDTAEACNLLLCSDKTVIKLWKEGKIRGNLAGRAYTFDTLSIREFICGVQEG